LQAVEEEKAESYLCLKKPTSPFGYIAFSKDGKVSKHIDTLPDTTKGQEEGVIQRFHELYNNSANYPRIEKSEPLLSEQGHDARIYIDNKWNEVQITELLRRDYTTTLTKEEYSEDKLKADHWIMDIDGNHYHAVDGERFNNALVEKIQKKVAKNYSKTEVPLWLIIFSTSDDYLIEWIENGVKQTSAALLNARHYIANQNNFIFDQVWFCHLLTKPIKMWPE
jgi:hypothetical protein